MISPSSSKPFLVAIMIIDLTVINEEDENGEEKLGEAYKYRIVFILDFQLTLNFPFIIFNPKFTDQLIKFLHKSIKK